MEVMMYAIYRVDAWPSLLKYLVVVQPTCAPIGHGKTWQIMEEISFF